MLKSTWSLQLNVITIPNKLNAIIVNIRAQRELKGFTQMYVAIKLKISQTAYSRIESGHSKITVNTLLAIAEILNMQVNKFLN